MNKFKKTLIAFLSALCLVCTGLFVVACNNDNEENKPGPAEQYTVTLDYEEEQGTVTLDPAGGKYEKDAQVEVTVNAKEGYAIDAFTVSTDPDAALDELGGYELTVTANVTITATFKETAQPAPSEFPEEFRGTWNCVGAEDWIVTITKDALTIADSEGNAIAATTTITSVEDFGTTFTTIETVVDETTYTVGLYANDNVLGFETEIPAEDEDSFPTRATIYFVKDPLPALSFSEDVYGSWTGESLDYPVDIGPNGLTYGISAGTLVYADAESNEYWVIVGGDLYFIMLSEDMLYFGDHMLTQSGTEAPEKTPLNAAFTGTWKDEAGTVTLVVDENGDVTWNGAEATPFYDGMVGIYVDGVSYYVNVSATNTLYLAGDTPYTLVKEIDSLKGTELESVIGTWKSYELDQDYTLTITDSSVKLTVDEEGTATDVPSIFSTVESDGYVEAFLYWFVNGQPKAYLVTVWGVYIDLSYESEDGESDEMLIFLPSPLPEIEIDSEIYGTWIDSEDDTFDALTIGADGIFWGENEMLVIYKAFDEGNPDYGSKPSTTYGAFCNGVLYYIVSSSDGIEFFDADSNIYAELTKKPDDQGGGGQGGEGGSEGGGEDVGSTTVPAWLLDTSYLSVEGLGVLSIGKDGKVTLPDYEIAIVELEDTSYPAMGMYHFTATVTLSVDGEVFDTLSLDGSSSKITATGKTGTYKFVAVASKINSNYQGLWKTIDTEEIATFNISETKVEYSGMEFNQFAYDGYTLYLYESITNSILQLSLDADNTDIMIFTRAVDDGGEVLESKMVLVKDGAKVGISSNELLVGTWTDAENSLTLTFKADGTATWTGATTYDTKNVVVLSVNEKFTATGKVIAVKLIIETDLIELEVPVENGVAGTITVTLPALGETFTFTKAAAAQA